jgi:hypothetical protein
MGLSPSPKPRIGSERKGEFVSDWEHYNRFWLNARDWLLGRN